MGKDTVFIDELPPGKGRKTEDRRGRALARAKDAHTDYNIYYSTADPALGKVVLAKQQGDGVDAHSLAVDPLFVDPEGRDYRLRPGEELVASAQGLSDDPRAGRRARRVPCTPPPNVRATSRASRYSGAILS